MINIVEKIKDNLDVRDSSTDWEKWRFALTVTGLISISVIAFIIFIGILVTIGEVSRIAMLTILVIVMMGMATALIRYTV